MPQQFQHTFTGKDTGVEIKPFDRLSRSQERMDNFLIRAEELKYKSFKENQDWMLETTKVTPQVYIAEKNTENQAKLLEDYNNQAAAIMKKAGGVENLTLEDKLSIQKGKQQLESAQAKMNADFERFKLDEQVMTRDAGRTYDINEWNNIKKKYLNEGTYSEDPLPVKEKPFESWLTNESSGYTGEVNTDVETADENGVKLKRKTWANMTLPQAQDIIRQGILLNEGERKNVMARFDKLPEAEKIKWLDTNKNGKVDETERTDENGVIAWAQQYQPFVAAILKEKSGQYSNLNTSSSGSKSFNWNENIDTSHNRNNEFPVRGTVDIDTDEGKVTLPNSLDFSGIARTTTDARKINTVLVPDGKGGYTEKPLGESASFDIVTYSPESDILVIKLKSNTSDRSYREGVNLVVKGSEFDDLLRRKPFGIDRSVFAKNKPTSTPQKGLLDSL